MKYYFKIPRDGQDVDTIIFAKKDRIIELNFITEKIETLADRFGSLTI